MIMSYITTIQHLYHSIYPYQFFISMPLSNNTINIINTICNKTINKASKSTPAVYKISHLVEDIKVYIMHVMLQMFDFMCTGNGFSHELNTAQIKTWNLGVRVFQKCKFPAAPTLLHTVCTKSSLHLDSCCDSNLPDRCIPSKSCAFFRTVKATSHGDHVFLSVSV